MAPRKTQEYEDLKKALDDIQTTLKSFMDQVSAKLTPLGEMMEEFRAQNEQRENRVDILISELDSMMLDGESSSSRGSQLSLGSPPPADLDRTLVADSQTCTDGSSSGGTCAVGDHKSLDLGDVKDDTKNIQEAPKSSVEDAFDCQTSSRNGAESVPVSSERGWPSQNEELSFDLLFDATDDIKAGPSGSFSPVNQHQDLDVACRPSSSSGGKPVSSRNKHTLNGGQPIKRKSHSPFTTNSPTKLSKLM